MKCKNYIFSLANSKIVFKLFLSVLLFALFSSGTVAQVKFGVKAPFKTIYFGQKIDFGTIDNSVNWVVSNKSGGTLPANLKGEEINDYVFEKPGTYEVKFIEIKKHTEDCSHGAFDENMTVEVSAVKMVFDFPKIAFSEKIQKGRNSDNIIVSVPVNVSFAAGNSAKFNSPDVMVAGIGSEIIAKPLQKEIVLKEGTQILKYKLSGVAKEEAYLMFDFVDVNNQVQCYNLPQIIN